MLIRFAVRNFRSIAEKQELLLAASSLKGHEDSLISVLGFRHQVLPSLTLFGANASGKSNILRALAFFRNGILRSHSKTGVGPIKRQPFRLGACTDEDTSFFECDFIVPEITIGSSIFSNVRFTYGFVISDTEVVEEWLYAYPHQHRQVWFHRNTSEDEVFYFGKELKGQNRVVSNNTRKDALFLSTAFANNHEQLTQIYDYFLGIHFRLDEFDKSDDMGVAPFLENDEIRDLIIKYLQSADVGICATDVTVHRAPESLSPLFGELEVLMAKHFPDNPDTGKILRDGLTEKKKVHLGHAGADGTVFFDLKDESRGTLAFLNLIGWVVVTILTGRTLIVDELDSSLHPLLCRKIIGLFNSKETNPRGAQIVFSTHDATLLGLDLLRRDQIWLTEKNNVGATHIYPLSDLKLRSTDNIEKGYLQGRFGAIPFLTFENMKDF